MTLTGSLTSSDVPIAADAVVVRARPETPWATAAAVEEALLGDERIARAARRLRSTLHELRVGPMAPEGRWLDRLRRASPGRPVVIEHAEALDIETQRLLQRAPAGLGHTVHLRFDAVPPSGPARSLAEAVGLVEGELPAAVPTALMLPDDAAVRLVLRAAAALQADGVGFDVGEVARRLDRSPLRVLELLQMAVEVGFPLADHGEGRLSMPPEARRRLGEGLLPSLQAAWSAPVGVREPDRTVEPIEISEAPPGVPEARVPEAREAVEGPPTADEEGLALLELARSLRARPGLGVRLQEAIEAARGAVERLADADVHAAAAARTTLAHLLVEHGAPASLDEALDAVVEASRALSEAGDALGAASLLNDQAEVWLKQGDPVRAAHLLHSAERGLDGVDGVEGDVERAETAHLLARLPLYVRARPGHGVDAAERALDHLDAAAQTYRTVGWVDRQAHVLDTRGRLMMLAGRHEEAVAALAQAAEVYRKLGDGLGLARATEGLAELWSAAGQPQRAVALLEQSLVLNAAARSPIGLAYVRRTAEALPEGSGRDRVLARVDEAQAAIGRVELPPGR